MQVSIRKSVAYPTFLDLMATAQESLYDQVDQGLYSQPVCYTGPGVIVQTQPGEQLIAYVVATDVGPRLTLKGSNLREATYLLHDAMEAAKAGIFEPLLTGAVYRLDGETEAISGYPQIFGWLPKDPHGTKRQLRG